MSAASLSGAEAIPEVGQPTVPPVAHRADPRHGVVEGRIDVDGDAHGPWDHLGGLLVCLEAAAAAGDLLGRPLVATSWSERRSPLVAATPALLQQIEAAVAPLTTEWVANSAAP